MSWIRRLGRCAGLWLVAMLLLAPAGAVAAGSRRLGQRPSVPAGAQSVGQLAQSTRLKVTVTLTPRDPAGLAAYATAVSTPGSSVYHQYLSVSRFAERFGPTQSQIAAARASLRGQGLSPSAVSPNGLSISVSASAGRLSSAFGTSFERYRLRGGRIAYANTSAPQVSGPGADVIQSVLGLNNLVLIKPLGLVHRARGPVSGALTARLGSPAAAVSSCLTPSAGVFTADQIAAAYGFNGLYSAGDLGSGVTVALFELEPYSTSDIAAYQSCYGTSTSVSNVTVDGGAGSGPGQGEAALDIEDVIGLAPRANILVYEGPNDNTGQGAYDTYARIVADDRAKVISTSWGLCEAQAGGTYGYSAENTLFQEAAAQGQSVFAAAGDSGSNDCGSASAKTPSVDDPASQPYVTGVGGTSLSVGPPRTESVWNDTSGAGGGGASTLWARPSYQSGFAVSQFNVSCGSGNLICREVPDVSADADPNTGYAIYWSGSWGVIGGTSAAAPTWASLLALAEASPSCAGAPVGFLNPLLYGAAATRYASDFYDITSGNNTDKVPGYDALTGYDMASGLGSPQGSNLTATLCNGHDTVSFHSTPPTQHGRVRRAITAVHVSAGSSKSENPIIYSATGLPAGISINASSGTIAGIPTRSGSYSVTVLARDHLGTLGRIRFGFVIAGLPSVSAGRLHISGRNGSLSLTVRAGQYASRLRRVALRFGPRAHLGGAAASIRKYVRVLALSGKRQATAVKVSRGRMYLSFKTASSASRIKLSGSELTLTRSLATGLSRSTKTLKLTVVMTDAIGAQTRAMLKLR